MMMLRSQSSFEQGPRVVQWAKPSKTPFSFSQPGQSALEENLLLPCKCLFIQDIIKAQENAFSKGQKIIFFFISLVQRPE